MYRIFETSALHAFLQFAHCASLQIAPQSMFKPMAHTFKTIDPESLALKSSTPTYKILPNPVLTCCLLKSNN